MSHNTSISSFGNKRNQIKEKDYELLHYFDDQSDNESQREKSKSKSKSKNKKALLEKDSLTSNNLYSSSSDNDSKNENFFEYDKDSLYDTNEKVIEKSPDGNYGKYDEVIYLSLNKTVYKGYDFNAGREISWCEIKFNQENIQNQINKIKEQIALRSELNNHDNILGYVNSWYEEYDNIYIIIEELCSGGNINSNYKYIQKPKLKLIKKWIKEILTGLDYLHSNKLIHHDIKCENIYLDRISGHLKIGCIGSLEKLNQGQEYFNKYIGTPEFMAPEVNEGKYGFKSDIYSLGLTLIELLTVQKPYKECEGALNIYINKKKGILPESFKTINDKGIKEFILLCLNKEDNRPNAKDILEKNRWLNDKNNQQNNLIIEIKGAFRQKNFYLNNRYKSGENFGYNSKSSFNRSVIRYNSRIFKTFNLKSKKSWKTNHNDSILNNNKDNIDNTSSFSFKNFIVNKSTSTSYIHKSDEEKEPNKPKEENISNNINCINSNKENMDFNNNVNITINKPIIKEKNDFIPNYGKSLFNKNNYMNDREKKFFSPDEKNKSNKILIHGLNIRINNLNNNYQKLNSFRESIRNKINVADNIINNKNISAIKAINFHYDENKYDELYDDNDENNNNSYINYKIIYTIICTDNKSITCEYNYERDSVDIIIKNLKEIMNLDINDIILLKKEFNKNLNEFMDKKKIQIFFEKYFFILNKIKIMGKICKKFDKIINTKNMKNIDDKDIIEKIKDFQEKKIIINNINNNTNKK
jgi:WNK lysine deficient protein kinase